MCGWEVLIVEMRAEGSKETVDEVRRRKSESFAMGAVSPVSDGFMLSVTWRASTPMRKGLAPSQTVDEASALRGEAEREDGRGALKGDRTSSTGF